MKKVAFICVHNSCRSQMAEAFGKALASDIFESFSAGSEIKGNVNPDAVRIMKEHFGIDMSENTPKTIDKIPLPDIAISMGCGVHCPYIGRGFDADWALSDPTGKEDAEFIKTAEKIRENILRLKNELCESK